MKTMWHIAMKDLKYLARSRTAFIAFLLMPILMMLMMSYIFPKMPSRITGKIGVLSFDPLFEKTVPKNKEMIFYKDRDELIKALARNEIIVAVIVPKGFMANTLAGKATLEVIPNPSNPQMAISIAQMMAGSMGNVSFSKKISVKLINVDGGKFNYYDFMAPGMMAMIAILSVATGLAASITRERELGTLDGLMVTPVKRGYIVSGKIIAQTIRGLIQALLILLVSFLLFNVTIQGSLALTILLLVLGTFSFIGIGIIVTAGMRDQETAQIVMSTITFPMMFFSGIFFPIDQMPKFAKYLSKFMPLTYAADALRKVITLGVGFGYIIKDILILLLFAVVSTTLATIYFPKLVKD